MKRTPKPTARLAQISFWLLVFFAVNRRGQAEGVDISKLPPPAATPIDFTRDIRPILENNCLRCHGPEKPRNQFRLDNRASALKGGDEGADILPGNSAKSPLIHYVAYLVEDEEMPPIGKDGQLTAQQVSLLRAWIDQGAVWDSAAATNTLNYTFAPMLGGTVVSGNSAKFRENNQQPEGMNDGVERFEMFQQTGLNSTLQASGHAWLDDYKIEVTKNQNELGFIHAGWEQFRTYYNDVGGYYPALVQPPLSLGQDLYLDTGKAYIDFGLTLPDWPKMVLGYEYDYQQGNESSTSWSTVGTTFGTARNIAPASRSVNENVNIIKFDLDDDLQGVTLAERFRGEFYQLNAAYTNVSFGPLPQSVSEGTTYFEGANTIRVEKKLNDWNFVSAGYLYSKLNADSSFAMDSPALFQQAAIPRINLEQDSNVGNLNDLLGPFDGLIISTGVQAEWTHQNGFGAGTYAEEIPAPPVSNLVIPFNVASDYDEASIQENVALHYAKIPFTTLYAEARLEQQNIGQNDQFDASEDILNKSVFFQHTAFSSQSEDLRFGFSTSPWRVAAFSAQYRHYEDASQYDSDPLVQPVMTAYPTFIQSRTLITDEVEAKLVLHPSVRFKTTLSYQYQDDTYDLSTSPYDNFGNIITPGGELTAGGDCSHIFSLNETMTPSPRVFLSTSVSYEITELTTMANGSPAVVPYDGNIYTVLSSGTYVLSETTDLFVAYAFSEANYGQNNFADGLPLGIQYQRHSAQIGLARHFGKHISAKLQYRLDHYDEASSGGANNYCANSVFGTLTFQFW